MSRIYVKCDSFDQYESVLEWKARQGHVWPSGNPVRVTRGVDYAEWSKYKSDTTLCLDNESGMARLDKAQKKGVIIEFGAFTRQYLSTPSWVQGEYISGTDFVAPKGFRLEEPKTPIFKTFQTSNQINNNQKTTTMKESIKSVMGLVKVSNEQVALTFSGKLAVQRKDGQYVRYDADNDAISVQSIMPTFKVGKFCFCIPTPSSSLKVGDIIVHKNDFKEVTRVEGGLKAINLNSGAENGIKKEVIEGLAGFSMLPKLTCLFNGGQMDATTGMNPMMLAMMMKEGNNMNDMLPLLLMGQGGQQNSMLPLLLASGEDIDPMMLMLMSQTQGEGAQAMNPMMMMAMMENKGGNDDMMQMMLMSSMMGGQNPFAPAKPVATNKDAVIAQLKTQLEAANTVDPKDAEIEALRAELAATKKTAE